MPGGARADLYLRKRNMPPSFPTMHRQGIARVCGDRVMLDGMTVEEVGQYQLRTLKLVVDATNTQRYCLLTLLKRRRRRIVPR